MRRTPIAALAVLCLLAASRAPSATAAAPPMAARVDQIVAGLRRASVEELWTAQRRLKGLGAEAVPAIKSRLPKGRPAQQIALAKALCSLGHAAAAVDPLVRIIESKDARDYAVVAARILGDPPANELQATEDHLLRIVANRALPANVQRAVARSLGLMASSLESMREANATLRRLLVAAKDPETRKDCALALGEIDDFSPPVEAILKDLKDEPTGRGRLAAALLQNNTFRNLLIRRKDREGTLNDHLLNEIKTLMQRYHTEAPLPDHELVNAAAKGMVHAVRSGDHPDRHSSYFDEKDWKRFREQISGHYGGIGAVVQFAKHFDTGDVPVFTVARPNFSGPAYKAGIRSYDRIVEVDGKPTAIEKAEDAPRKLKEIVKLLRGKPGTPVEVTVTSPGSKKRRKIKIARAEIQLPTVRTELLPAKIGYLRLAAFGQRSARELEKALLALERRGMRALIFDLRNNPGGQLSAAVRITDKFLKHNKLIVYTQGRNPAIAKREDFRTKDPTTHPDYPMVVLVNSHSASASEIVSGALQDHKRAVVLGTTTYGKGSVQKLFPLRATARRSALKLTIAKYYLPSGRSIHGKGVKPDVEVDYKPTFTPEEMAELRENGAFYRYTASRFAQHKELFAKLAEFDALAASRYPDSDAWFKGLAGEIGRDKARRLLRAWLRILVADDRGKEFTCDLEEDNQLQKAILELAKRFEDIDPRMIPQYRHFAAPAKKTAAKAKKTAARPSRPN